MQATPILGRILYAALVVLAAPPVAYILGFHEQEALKITLHPAMLCGDMAFIGLALYIEVINQKRLG